VENTYGPRNGFFFVTSCERYFSSRCKLWQNRDFLRVITSHLLSKMGTKVVGVWKKFFVNGKSSLCTESNVYVRENQLAADID
jgi:hypothetical protein